LYESGAVVQEVQTTAPTAYKDPMGLDLGVGTDEPNEEEGLLSPSQWDDDDEGWP
jgi:hypothetical protein